MLRLDVLCFVSLCYASCHCAMLLCFLMLLAPAWAAEGRSEMLRFDILCFVSLCYASVRCAMLLLIVFKYLSFQHGLQRGDVRCSASTCYASSRCAMLLVVVLCCDFVF